MKNAKQFNQILKVKDLLMENFINKKDKKLLIENLSSLLLSSLSGKLYLRVN